jgi:hypothetical protein
MMVNTSTVTATVGSARFEAAGPAEVVFTQYARFLSSLKASPASAPETGPLPPGVVLMRRFITVGVAATLPPALPPAVRFVDRFGPPSCCA